MQFDPESTKIDFTLGDVLHTVHGSFHLKSGTISFDPETGASSGALIVDASSGDSGNHTRDHKMTRDILQTQAFPDVVFSPKHVSGVLPAEGSATIQVAGFFSIHGAEHEIVLSVPVTVSGNDIALHTELLVPYVAWGMKNPSTFLLRVSSEVKIDIAGTAHLANSAPISQK